MASGFTFDISNFNESIDELKRRVDIATRDATALGGHQIEREAKLGFDDNPAQRPDTHGPRPYSVSGNQVRSIKLIPRVPINTGPGQWTVSIAPTMVYGRRIELGFHGTDSIGRHYNQPGYPFLKPGLDKAIPVLPRIFADTWARALAR